MIPFHYIRGPDLQNMLRPFKIVSTSDGRPAVEVDNDGKQQRFVSVAAWSYHDFFYLNLFLVRGRAVVNGFGKDA